MRDRRRDIINGILVFFIIVLLGVCVFAFIRMKGIHDQRVAEAEERKARREEEYRKREEGKPSQSQSEEVSETTDQGSSEENSYIPDEVSESLHEEKPDDNSDFMGIPALDYDTIPEFAGLPYYELNDNRPYFLGDTLSDYVSAPFAYYSPLDILGRCGTARAVLSWSMMPIDDREPIGSIKPSGWHTVKYPDLIEDRYLYNRCHLIAYCLTGENANERNLITGTRYLNIKGMLPFEREVADYIENTNNHVAYRVTPWFEGVELVARGVVMEAYSVEDDGLGVCFNVFVYNVQPGITIDYQTGISYITEE